MSAKRKINIAIVGLGFGAEFIPIYQLHPGANMYAICQGPKTSWTPSAMPLMSKNATLTSMSC